MTSPLMGRFNVYNTLAALAVAHVEGVSMDVAVAALARVAPISGRFERVDAGQEFPVIVDYAHTPDSLENVLLTAREFTRGRLIVVFGCGGDRDRGKRPKMGRVAAQVADHVIITSDNPRSEDPEAIITGIEEGVVDGDEGKTRWEIIVERGAAIERAVAVATGDDVVVIAGKGHETYQIFRDRTIEFDDRRVARKALAERLRKGRAR